MKIQMLKDKMYNNKDLIMLLNLKDEKGLLDSVTIEISMIEELKSVVFINFDLDLEKVGKTYQQDHNFIIDKDYLNNIDGEKEFKIKLNFNNKFKIFDIKEFDYEDIMTTTLVTIDYAFPLFYERGLYKKEIRIEKIKEKRVSCADEFVIVGIKHTYAEDEKSDNHFKREIIELSAGIYDKRFNLKREFSKLIKPEINPILTERCQGITHISNEMLRNSKSFTEIYNMFLDFLGDDKKAYTYFMFDNGALTQLKRCVYFSGGGECDFLHYTDNFYSIQDLYCINNNTKKSLKLNDMFKAKGVEIPILLGNQINKVKTMLEFSFSDWGF